MNIIFLGPQGSGKGTQAKRLASFLNNYYYSAGDVLRSIAHEDPTIDKAINEVGALVGDELMFAITKRTLEKANTNNFKDIVFDGYPRSQEQYQLLKKFLEEKNSQIDIAIILEINIEESIKRLAARRIHKVTGEIFNLITNPPGPEIKSEDLFTREDDNEVAIKERINKYLKATEPLIKELETEGKVIRIHAEKPIADVAEEVKRALNL